MTTFSTEIRLNNPTYESKEEGIQAAYDHTSEEWKEAAETIIYRIATKQALLTSDDIVRQLEAYPELERSYGGIPGLLKKAKKNKWITEAMCSCGEECKTAPSLRLSNHGHKNLVYRSLLV